MPLSSPCRPIPPLLPKRSSQWLSRYATEEHAPRAARSVAVGGPVPLGRFPAAPASAPPRTEPGCRPRCQDPGRHSARQRVPRQHATRSLSSAYLFSIFSLSCRRGTSDRRGRVLCVIMETPRRHLPGSADPAIARWRSVANVVAGVRRVRLTPCGAGWASTAPTGSPCAKRSGQRIAASTVRPSRSPPWEVGGCPRSKTAAGCSPFSTAIR